MTRRYAVVLTPRTPDLASPVGAWVRVLVQGNGPRLRSGLTGACRRLWPRLYGDWAVVDMASLLWQPLDYARPGGSVWLGRYRPLLIRRDERATALLLMMDEFAPGYRAELGRVEGRTVYT